MKRLIIAAALVLTATAAWANCTTNTIIDSNTGRVVFCTTCCHYGNCTTTCTY